MSEEKKIIGRFWNDYEFLSNFSPSRIFWDNNWWDTVEHAYQAAKTLDPIERDKIRNAKTPGEAKRLGRRVTMRDGWDSMKIAVMRELLRLKFADPELRQKLLNTGDAELVEGNNWRDTFWGVYKGTGKEWRGENWLGRLLMEVRSEIQDEGKS